VSALLALFGFLVFAARRLLTYLHLFQQEEYAGSAACCVRERKR